MPRGAPQWRHLIGVEEGASSAHSKVIPRPSQILQMTSNPFVRPVPVCIVILKRAVLDKAAKRK